MSEVERDEAAAGSAPARAKPARQTTMQQNAHLLSRATMGVTREQWDELRDAPYDDVVDAVLAELDAPQPPDPDGFDAYRPGSIQQLWLERMVSAPYGLAERLTLFWHGHFATSDAKIQNPTHMWAQYRLLRRHCAGSFDVLVKGICRDVAMIFWLDGNSNRKGHANENFARELQELFTLGIGHYTEDDVREVARAFTGWGTQRGAFVFRPAFHDDGTKTIHGETGTFDGDDVVRILLAQPACSAFLATKLWRFFVHPDPKPDDVRWLSSVLREHDFHIKKTLSILFRDARFTDTANHRTLVKGPVDFVVGALRALGLRTVPSWIHGSLDRMGQILFRPPSVKGWTSSTGWLTSGALVERLRVAQRLAALAPLDASSGLAKQVFGGEIPEAIEPALGRVRGRDRIALILGCPEFQLS